MQENGIFGQWAASYLKGSDEWYNVDLEGANFKPARTKYFNGLFAICSAMIASALLVGTLEMVNSKIQLVNFKVAEANKRSGIHRKIDIIHNCRFGSNSALLNSRSDLKQARRQYYQRKILDQVLGHN